MIIDGHTHIISGFSNPSIINLKFDWEDLEHWLSSEPESKCVITPYIEQLSDSVKLNVEFMERLKDFPMRDRVFPFLWIHPNQLAEKHLKMFDFSGFKFHPSISQTTITENQEMLDTCAKHRKPILVHCGRGEKSRIDYVLKVNENYPELKFICAHMGGLATDLIVRAFEKISQSKFLDNIYLDTSGCFLPPLIEKATKLLGSHKVIFGTDRPFHSYKMSLYTIECCDFGKELREKLLFGNILNILGNSK